MGPTPERHERQENSNEQAEQSALFASTTAAEGRPETMNMVRRFWDIVNKAADVIVTLRQENAILQAQNQTLRHSESDIQKRVEGFLERIAELERDVLERTERAALATEEAAALREELAAQYAAAQAATATAQDAVNRAAESQSELTVLRQVQTQVQPDTQPTTADPVTDKQPEPPVADQPLSQHEALRNVIVPPVVIHDIGTIDEASLEELDALRTKAQALEATNADLMRVNADLSAAHSALGAEHDDLKARYEAQIYHIDRLEDELRELRARMEEATAQLADYSSISEQLDTVREELELRTSKLDELQDQLAEVLARRDDIKGAEGADEASLIAERDEEILELRRELAHVSADLARSMEIVEIYRAAGLRHLEDPTLANQMALFGVATPSPASVPTATVLNKLDDRQLRQLAGRIDAMADRIAVLFGIH
ncbi:MAG TPA: hypothetical protein DIS79_04890 [Bacteroidetes bacterium]|nr:hypothetical protein [Bacteroidota bacterium]HRK05371.1 hypothetical protein [Chlorobiota bacterium]